MLLLFIVEFSCGSIERCPVSCDETKAMSINLPHLRFKLQISSHSKVDLRLSTGAPLDVNRTPKQLGLETNGSIFAIVDVPFHGATSGTAATNASQMRYGGRDNNSSDGSHPNSRSPPPQGKVTKLGPQGDEDDDTTDAYTDEDTMSEASSKLGAAGQLREPAGMHTFPMDGRYCKCFIKGHARHGDVVVKEDSLFSVAYPMQLAELIRTNDMLKSRSFDPSTATHPSSVLGLDDATYTKYLSIAMTHGRKIETTDRFKQQLAFYPLISCVRHSCSPNASVVANLKSVPFEAMVRCVSLKGLDEGDEVTALYPAVDTVGFLLLPKERRHQHLQKKYHFTCDCERCSHADRSELEATLTGAFFKIEGHSAQRALSDRMRTQFGQLNLLDSITGLPTKDMSKGDAGKLCQYLLDFSGPDAKLQLHPNHWRLSIVRTAFMWHCVRGTLDRQCFDAALQQLQTEAHFVPLGHPLSLPTYRRLKLMISRLPPRLAASVQKKGLETPGIPWDVLMRLDSMGVTQHSG